MMESEENKRFEIKYKLTRPDMAELKKITQYLKDMYNLHRLDCDENHEQPTWERFDDMLIDIISYSADKFKVGVNLLARYEQPMGVKVNDNETVIIVDERTQSGETINASLWKSDKPR